FARFMTEQRPVRWWHVSQTFADSGRRIAPGGDPTPTPVWYDGAVSSGVRENLDHTIVVVDATRAAGVRLDALADYLAMVSLANLNPATDTRQFPTILNLFADPTSDNPRPEAMSAWDVAYLEGLYHMQRNALNWRRQRAEVAARMSSSLNR